MSEMANTVLNALGNLSHDELLDIASTAAAVAKEKEARRWEDAKLAIEDWAAGFDLTPSQLFDRLFPAEPTPPKYFDPASGKSWSGRGVVPKWLQALCVDGVTLDNFLTVKPE